MQIYKFYKTLSITSRNLFFGICLNVTLSATLLANNGHSQNLEKCYVSISVDNALLTSIFNKIEKQTVFKFSYDHQVESIDSISLHVKNESLLKVLRRLQRITSLRYRQINNTIAVVANRSDVRRKGTSADLNFPSIPISMNNLILVKEMIVGFPVKGKVLDETGNPLPGVNVVEKGTTNGAVTDVDGKYSLSVGDEAVLVFSFVGYKTREISVVGKTTLDIELASDSKMLDELVVVGYGTKKKENLTGAVSTVNSDVLESRPSTNVLSLLQGELPGTFIQRTSGQPGVEGYSLNVRGPSSTNGAGSPLVLIDGVVGSLDLINPADIESITALKDAQASIYGARAAGGVLLVTTKKGKGNTPKITYNNNFSVTKATGLMKSPTTYEMAIMDNEANIHNGAAPLYTPDFLNRIKNNDPNPIPHPIYKGWKLFFTNTDWFKELLENGFQQMHNISISGSNSNSAYYLSGRFTDQQGVVRFANDNNRLFNLRLNYDYNLTKRLRLETKIFLENQRRSDIAGVGDWVIGEAILGFPNHPVYTPEGKFFAQGGWKNAVAFAKEAPTANFYTRNINTNFKLIVDIFDDLKLNLQAGLNQMLKNGTDVGKPVPLYQWDGTLAYYSIANPGQSWIKETNEQTNYQNYSSYLQYAKKFNNTHDLDVMVGGSYEKNRYKSTTATRYNVISDDVWDLNLAVGDMDTKGGAEHWAISSLFARVGYIYKNKYLVEGNIRYDGSSRFQLSDKRWGLFPGVSLGWRISNEAFFESINWISELKLRASYGRAGNQDGIGLYDFIQQLSVGGAYPFGAGRQDRSASLQGMVAYNRTWETIINRNIGFDAAFISHKLTFSFDYFNKTNKDMLIKVQYPSLLGATPATSNSGELKTWGFEAAMGWRDKVGELQYSAKFLISDAQNKLVNLGGANTYTLGLNKLREGFPIDTYFAYEFDGVIRTQAELDKYKSLGGVPSDIGMGDAKFKDLNHDGKISLYSDKPGDDGDVKNTGNTAPRYSYGINLGTKYKGFDFTLFVQGVGKRTLFRTGDYSMPWSDWWRQPPQFYYGQTWNEDRQDAVYPRLTHGNIRKWNYQASTLQQINAAYIRLKNIQLGYTFPEHIVSKISLSRLRIYFSGQDLWEAHRVKGGWDPESVDWGGNYPFQRYYSIGFDLTF